MEEMEDFRGVMAMEMLEFREDGEWEERKLRENEMKWEKVKIYLEALHSHIRAVPV